MSKSFLTGINLNKNILSAVVIDTVSSDVSSPAAGQIWFNSTTGLWKYYNGTTAIDPLNRTNHSGTQLASTISNLATTVQAYTLNSFATPTASLALGGFTITGLGTPVNSTDAATKAYVDSSVAGLSWKNAVAAATTSVLTVTYSNGSSGVGATLTNAGTQAAFAVDGYTASVNDRILVKNQASGFQNGIYSVTSVGSGSTNWVLTRTTDSNTSAEVTDEAVYVENGTVNAATGYVQTAVNPTLGTTSLTYSQFSGSGTYSAGSGLTLTGNTFSIGSAAISNTMLANSSVTVSAGSGLSGGGTVSLGGTITLTNAGVTSNVAGTGISVSGATGAVTITNTGVTSIAGTSNQITASASTGAVTLSLPSTVSLTNLNVSSLTANGNVYVGTSGAVVSTAAMTNGQILIGSTSSAPVLGVITGGTGLSVTNGAGTIALANTGVTSLVAGSGISISGSTGAVTVSATGGGGTVNKYATTIGDGSTTSYTVTHNLGSLDFVVSVYLVSGGAEVQADITHASTTTVTIAFTTAPATNTIRVVVVG